VPGKKQESSPTDVGMTTTRIEVFLDAPEDHRTSCPRSDRCGADGPRCTVGSHQGGFTDHSVTGGPWRSHPHNDSPGALGSHVRGHRSPYHLP
jgi:hypothetical protein